MVLNIGCGKTSIKDTIGVDIQKPADKLMDLRIFPWDFKDNSVDGIYMVHVLEHLPDIWNTIAEINRILKPGGFLYIEVPHSSHASSIGSIEHYRTFALTFSESFSKFKTIIPERLLWLRPFYNNHSYIKYNPPYPKVDAIFKIVRIFPNPIIQFLIDLSPVIFERLWCHYVGGASTILWKGVKI